VNEIDQFGLQTIDAIKRLVAANRYLQALVVLYSAIDTFAWVNLESGDVTRSVFCQWVNTYIAPEKMIGCSAQDLYSARCATVHSATSVSNLSRSGKARELWYVTSSSSAERLQNYAQSIGSNAHVVPFTLLVAAFTEGAMNFSEALSRDPELNTRCVQRMKHWLRFMPVQISEESSDLEET
jgi:hypothetical protein